MNGVPLLVELCEHVVLGEEVVVEGLSGRDSLCWVLLQQSLHEVEP